VSEPAAGWGLGVLREVAQALNRDMPPEGNLLAVATILDHHLPTARVTIWRRRAVGPALHPVSSGGESVPLTPVDTLPPPAAGTLRIPILRAGHRLGALDLLAPGDLGAAHREVAEGVGELLGPFLDAALLSEDLADELATRAREVREQRQFTNLIIDSLPVGLYVVDRDYQIQVWNRKRETGTQGLQRHQVLGRRIFDVLTSQPADTLRAELDAVLDHGELNQEEIDVTRGGEARVYRLTRVPMRLDGDEVSHVITIGEDVTEQRETQRRIMQSEKLAAVGQLAAGVMHEINNPLATIGACVAAIDARVGSSAGAEVSEYLEIIEREVERCTGIVDQLLDFSRAQPRVGRAEPVALHQLLGQTLFLLKHHARFKRLTVEQDLADELPAVVVDGERIIQAFMAIMLNAADAMERGGTLRIRTGWTPGRQDELFTEFADSGSGIPPEEMSKIFEPFFTTKPPGRGTGLGLTITFGIIEEQGGRITVESEPGRGTSFRVCLPVQRPESAP